MKVVMTKDGGLQGLGVGGRGIDRGGPCTRDAVGGRRSAALFSGGGGGATAVLTLEQLFFPPHGTRTKQAPPSRQAPGTSH